MEIHPAIGWRDTEMNDAQKRAKANEDLGYYPASVDDESLARALATHESEPSAEDVRAARIKQQVKYQHLLANRREHG